MTTVYFPTSIIIVESTTLTVARLYLVPIFINYLYTSTIIYTIHP